MQDYYTNTVVVVVFIYNRAGPNISDGAQSQFVLLCLCRPAVVVDDFENNSVVYACACVCVCAYAS